MWGNGPVTLRGLILSKVFGSSRETPTATTITVVTILNKSGFKKKNNLITVSVAFPTTRVLFIQV